MPSKKKVIAKAKKKSADAETMAAIKERYDYANAIFEIQDEPTKQLIRHLEGKAQEMGRQQNEAGRMMSRYVVIRLLIACAKWDIRIGKFKLPKKRCADCGVKV
jgi:hypothetical protein